MFCIATIMFWPWRNQQGYASYYRVHWFCTYDKSFNRAHMSLQMPVVPDKSLDRSLFDEAKSWVRQKYNKPGNVFLGVVHRLDRPVSGVVVFGRTSKGAARLR